MSETLYRLEQCPHCGAGPLVIHLGAVVGAPRETICCNYCRSWISTALRGPNSWHAVRAALSGAGTEPCSHASVVKYLVKLWRAERLIELDPDDERQATYVHARGCESPCAYACNGKREGRLLADLVNSVPDSLPAPPVGSPEAAIGTNDSPTYDPARELRERGFKRINDPRATDGGA